MQKLLATLLTAAALAGLASPALAQSRIKDIAAVEGVRSNQLVGYGLVVGLNGTGDRLRSAVFTRQSLVGMLERLGVDPAIASSIFVTTFTDVCGFGLLLGLATAILL